MVDQFDQEYVQGKKHFQDILLKYIDDDANSEENYENLVNFFLEKKIADDKSEIKIIFKMIIKISNHHYRSSNFFSKIEKIILIFKDEIPKYFTNSELFNLFRRNRRVLLFLFEEKILEFSSFVLKNLSKYTNDFYYFYPEIIEHSNPEQDNLLEEKKAEIIQKIENNLDDFYKLRKIGENDSYVCQLIRKDDVDSFAEYIKKNKIKLQNKSFSFFSIEKPTKIDESFYETNSFLIKNKYRLDFTNYACYFGSIKIFKFLLMNKIELNGFLWNFAIHGRNMEIIHILEQQKIQPISNYNNLSSNSQYEECFEMAMKNFHDDIADYIHLNYIQKNNTQMNFMQSDYQQQFFRSNFMTSTIAQPIIQQITKQQKTNEITSKIAIKYFNFKYFPLDLKQSKYNFDYLCKNGFLALVEHFFKTLNINTFYFDQFIDSYSINNTIFKVAEKENIEILELLYNAHPFDPNMTTYNSYGYRVSETMLHASIKKDNAKMVQFLVSLDNININKIYMEGDLNTYNYKQNNNNNEEEEDESDTFFNKDLDDYSCVKIKKTALHLAIENKNQEIVSILLNHPKINVNILQLDLKYLYDRITGTESTKKIFKTRFITTALLTAIKNDDVEIVRLLLSNPKIDVNKKSKFDYKYHYHYHGKKKRGKDENHSRTSCGHELKTPLFYAIEKRKSIEIIKLLLSHHNININLESSFINDNERLLSFMKRMMEYDVNPTEVVDNAIKIKEIVKTPLEMAYDMKNDELSRLLLENQKIDVNYKSGGEQIFKNAVKNNDINAIKSYLAIPGFNIKKALKGTLQIAIQNDNIDLFKFLLNLPEININDKLNGKTPLQVAAEKENVEVVKLLLERPELKYDINKVFENINEKKIEIISLLLNTKENK